MSAFMPLVKKKYEFQKDVVHIAFKRLTRQQMMQLTPYLPDEGREPTPEEGIKLMDIAAGFLKDNLNSVTGLHDAEGGVLNLKEYIDDTYFMSLVTDICTDLMRESMLDPKSGKKPKGDSTNSTAGLQDTQEKEVSAEYS